MSTSVIPLIVQNEKGDVVARELASSSASTNHVPGRNFEFQPPSRYQTTVSLDIDDYFAGPRDMQKHSKLPFFMRIHGSILPKMILPLLFVGAWTTAMVCIHKLYHEIEVDTVLLTVLGFVVGLALSFRSVQASISVRLRDLEIVQLTTNTSQMLDCI